MKEGKRYGTEYGGSANTVALSSASAVRFLRTAMPSANALPGWDAPLPSVPNATGAAGGPTVFYAMRESLVAFFVVLEEARR